MRSQLRLNDPRAHTFFRRHAYLVGRAGDEEISHGDQEVPVANVPQIGRRSHERLPAAKKKHAHKGD
jgi:hypothetical protein